MPLVIDTAFGVLIHQNKFELAYAWPRKELKQKNKKKQKDIHFNNTSVKTKGHPF